MFMLLRLGYAYRLALRHDAMILPPLHAAATPLRHWRRYIPPDILSLYVMLLHDTILHTGYTYDIRCYASYYAMLYATPR